MLQSCEHLSSCFAVRLNYFKEMFLSLIHSKTVAQINDVDKMYNFMGGVLSGAFYHNFLQIILWGSIILSIVYTEGLKKFY